VIEIVAAPVGAADKASAATAMAEKKPFDISSSALKRRWRLSTLG
jgi:hypothetical protein